MRHSCPWSCSCRHGPTAQSTSNGTWYSTLGSQKLCPCTLYLFPSTANYSAWFIKTTPSPGSATCWRQGVLAISSLLCISVQKALPLHSPLTQWSQRLSRSQDLAGSCKPTAWPQGFVDTLGLVISLLKACSACQGISQSTSSTHRQLTHTNILNIINSISPNVHCLSQKCFPPQLKTLHTGTDVPVNNYWALVPSGL